MLMGFYFPSPSFACSSLKSRLLKIIKTTSKKSEIALGVMGAIDLFKIPIKWSISLVKNTKTLRALSQKKELGPFDIIYNEEGKEIGTRAAMFIGQSIDFVPERFQNVCLQEPYYSFFQNLRNAYDLQDLKNSKWLLEKDTKINVLIKNFNAKAEKKINHHEVEQVKAASKLYLAANQLQESNKDHNNLEKLNSNNESKKIELTKKIYEAQEAINIATQLYEEIFRSTDQSIIKEFSKEYENAFKKELLKRIFKDTLKVIALICSLSLYIYFHNKESFTIINKKIWSKLCKIGRINALLSIINFLNKNLYKYAYWQMQITLVNSLIFPDNQESLSAKELLTTYVKKFRELDRNGHCIFWIFFGSGAALKALKNLTKTILLASTSTTLAKTLISYLKTKSTKQ